MKYLYSLLLIIGFSSIAMSQNLRSEFVYFDHDVFLLSEKANIELERIVEELLSYSDFSLQIFGHTDQDGSSNYNNLLAKERAEQVYYSLMERGISSEKMLFRSFGESQLELKHDSAEAKAKNRRVELKISYYNFEDVEELMVNLSENRPQKFEISSIETIDLNLAMGSYVHLEKNSFVYEDGSEVDGLIELEIIEAFSFNQFAQQNLSCVSDGKILESGGMMNLSAKSNGKTLKLKKGRAIDIQYPVQAKMEDMELFYGNREEDGSNNWQVADSDFDFIPEIQTEELSLEIDLASLLIGPIEMESEPKFSVKKMPNYPRRPKRPYAPLKPRLIEKDKYNIKLTRFQRLFMSKSKKTSIREEGYADLLEEHSEKMEIYEKKLVNFNLSYQEYLIDEKNYEKEVSCWNEDASSKYNSILEYKNIYKLYNEKLMSFHAQRYLRGNLENDDKLVVLNRFCQLMHLIPKENISRKLLIQVFGPKYEKILTTLDKKPAKTKTNGLAQDKAIKDVKQKSIRLIHRINVLEKEVVNSSDLGRFAISITELGWINCDRFLSYKGERINYALQEGEGAKFFMIFKNQRTFIGAKKSGNQFVFENIPDNQEVSIVGVKMMKNKPMLFYKSFNSKKDVYVQPNFRKSSLAEIKAVFQNLDDKV